LAGLAAGPAAVLRALTLRDFRSACDVYIPSTTHVLADELVKTRKPNGWLKPTHTTRRGSHPRKTIKNRRPSSDPVSLPTRLGEPLRAPVGPPAPEARPNPFGQGAFTLGDLR